ncbi:hypothetical protein IFM89_020922 [Coptis chinensis]|uniref:Uncharacterized protein n=1 Tax=Coptis chinensis TaxID=261450 RepID=A0A835M6U5_9MAGN|nr:hypothetical protein IFM89_020922 [Coptis chinensis]
MLIFNSSKHFGRYALPRLGVPRYPPRTRNGELYPFSARLFGLKNAGFYGRSVTRMPARPWGDLVVPTGWRRWGQPMDFPSFCRISLKGEGEIVHQAVRARANLILFPRIPDEGTLGEPPTPTTGPCNTIHTRSDQLPILPPLRS